MKFLLLDGGVWLVLVHHLADINSLSSQRSRQGKHVRNAARKMSQILALKQRGKLEAHVHTVTRPNRH